MSNAPQYITGNWSHIFDGERSERMTRVVLDAPTQKLLVLQVQRNRAVIGSYGLSTRTELLDVEDSMVNANPELFDDPSAFGLAVTDSLPVWATSQIEESALRVKLAELQGEFEAAGGRGVDVAEQIDAIQRQLGEYEGDDK
ncbi:hypothetical protein ACM7YY_09945 [Pseudomonas aeruginosa]